MKNRTGQGEKRVNRLKGERWWYLRVGGELDLLNHVNWRDFLMKRIYRKTASGFYRVHIPEMRRIEAVQERRLSSVLEILTFLLGIQVDVLARQLENESGI